MSFFYGFAVYFVIWWITLFLVLPYGVRTQAESETKMVPGTEPGAPVNAYLGRKLLVNTALSGIVFGAWYFLTVNMGFTMETLAGMLFDFDGSK